MQQAVLFIAEMGQQCVDGRGWYHGLCIGFGGAEQAFFGVDQGFG